MNGADIAGEANQQASEFYHAYCLEAIKRLEAISDSISEMRGNPDHPNVWRNVEFCSLQIRLICECIASSVALLHAQFGHSVELGSWKPKDLLAQCSRLSTHPTPIPLEVNKVGESQWDFKPISKPVSLNDVSKLYGVCNDILHLPKPRKVLSQQIGSINADNIIGWHQKIEILYSCHCILLPAINNVLLWKRTPQPQTFQGDASGGGVFVSDDLAEFPWDLP